MAENRCPDEAIIKAEKKRQRAYGVATRHAKAAGYEAYVRLHSGARLTWEFVPPTSEYFPQPEVRETDGRTIHHIEGRGGRGEVLLLSSYRLDGILRDGGGLTVVLFLYCGPSAGVRAYAVGCCNGQISLQPLPQITPECFQDAVPLKGM